VLERDGIRNRKYETRVLREGVGDDETIALKIAAC